MAGWAPPRSVVTQEWLETELTVESTEQVAMAERALFGELAGARRDHLLLFGAGNLGRRALAGLRPVGVEPVAFADNDASLHGTVVDGLRVFSPEEAAARFRRSAVFVVTIWTNGPLAYPTVHAQMRSLGGARTVPFLPLFWRYGEEFLPNFCLDLPHLLYAEADSVQAAYRGLADDASRREFRTQLSYLLSAMDRIEVATPSGHGSYFPRDLVDLSGDEVFVDCGAYDGDTIESFLEATAGHFREVVAFEPDPGAADRLGGVLQGLPSDVRLHIRVERRAVGAAHGSVRFEGGGTPGSRLSPDGALTVELVPLDVALEGLSPTIIKMDIEGAEEGALRGAEATIRVHRPVLAVCVYHVQAHLHRLPLLMADLCRDYSLFLRRQGPLGDLVCFAIPNERLRR